MSNSNKKDNLGIIIKDFYSVPLLNDIQLTTYEKMMFQKYIYDDLKMHQSKEIDFNSPFVKQIFDFCRFYNFHN
jgi:hypothetical protein